MYTKKIRYGGSTWVGKRSLRGLRSREAEEGEQGEQLLPHLKTWVSKHISLLPQKS